MAEVFVARQPIFTRTLDVAGYELLFRSGEASRAGDFDRAQRLVRGAGDLYLEALMWADDAAGPMSHEARPATRRPHAA